MSSITAKISQRYVVGQTIGSGGQAEVRLGTCKHGVHPGGRVAVKIAKISSSNPKELMDKEIQLLDYIESHNKGNQLDVVRCYEHMEDSQHVVLILELCQGGELFDDIIDNGKYSERDAAASINTMSRTLSELQKIGVIHRDIKPENFVYDKRGSGRVLKLIDFGMACMASDSEQTRRSGLGTPAYQAPEIYRHEPATTASDIWSLGVVLFIMLSGTFPFNPNNGDAALKKSILCGNFTFSPREWKKISPEAKDLISRMLTVDLRNRITIAGILTHPWLVNEQTKQPFDNDFHTRLRSAKAATEFRGAILAMVTAKKWMKRSLTHAVSDSQVGEECFRTVKSVGPTGTVEKKNLGYIHIPVVDLKNLLVKFRVRAQRTGVSSISASPERNAEEAAATLAARYEVDFPTFATVVSSVYSCRVFCSLVFFNMFDTQQFDRLDYRKFLLAIASLRAVIDDEWVEFCFNIFDEDGSKTIDRHEFFAFAPCFCGTAGGNVEEKRSELADQMADLALPLVPTAPNNGNATPPAAKPPSPPTAQLSPSNEDTLKDDELVKAFHAVDKDGSGQIDITEFKEWLVSLYGRGNCNI